MPKIFYACVTCYIMQIRIPVYHYIEYYNRTDIKVKELGFFTVYSMKACRRSRGVAPHILNVGTRWKRVITFTSRPLCPRCLLNRRLGGGPQSLSWRHVDKIKFLPLLGIEPRFLGHPVHSLGINGISHSLFRPLHFSFYDWNRRMHTA